MRNRLRAVHQHRDTTGVRQVDQGLDRIDGAEGVGQVHECHQLDPPTVQQPFILFQNQLAGIGERHDFQGRAAALAQQLPGHDIGVVLHAGDDDFVAGPDPLAAETAGHQVDAFGGVAGEDDLLNAGGIQKSPYFLPRAFVGAGGAFRQQMDAAMDVGVIAAVTLADGVDHRLGFLHRGGVVQIDQRLAVDPLAQNGKIGADAGKIQLRRGNRGGGKRERGIHVTVPRCCPTPDGRPGNWPIVRAGALAESG